MSLKSASVVLRRRGSSSRDLSLYMRWNEGTEKFFRPSMAAKEPGRLRVVAPAPK